ncbi:hypothetical protein NC652_026941 [Populus alba x Populus x berolinensis]|nr:hypothetical protein NC652_026941 [Populus alba x Populus x berolinensis]
MHLYHAVETPTTPDAFEIFGGSPWLIHSRAFMEYCVQGWDNLPLMYLSNTASPLESCNTLESCTDDESLYDKMLNSGAAFARPFKEDAAALDVIDENVLSREPN